jgi:hypothetical protein
MASLVCVKPHVIAQQALHSSGQSCQGQRAGAPAGFQSVASTLGRCAMMIHSLAPRIAACWSAGVGLVGGSVSAPGTFYQPLACHHLSESITSMEHTDFWNGC